MGWSAMKKYVMFDLDGTIIDSAPGILNGFEYALKFYGRENINKQDFMKYIGPPLIDSMAIELGEENAAPALAKYREYYSAKGQYECSVYDGVREMIKRLHGAGCTLVLATSKKESLAVSIMEHIGFAEYFHVLAGSDDVLRKDKTSVMRWALEQAGIVDFSQAVMVGDRMYDIESSKELGVECIGVLYGFGSLEELSRYGADHIARTAGDVGDIVLNT